VSAWLRQHLPWMSLLALLATGVCYYSVMTGNHYVDPPHNGLILKNAIDLLEGRVMFRDSYNPYGLLSTVIHATGMTIWGWRITAPLNITLLFVVAIGLGIYYLWSRVMPAWAAFLAAILYFVYSYRIHLPWPNYYATFFALGVGILLMIWVQSGHRRIWLVAAGLTAGLVFLARQTLAPPLLGLTSLFLLFVHERPFRPESSRRLAGVTTFLVSFLAAILPFFVYLSCEAAVKDWWIQSVRLVPLYFLPFAQIHGGVLSLPVSIASVLLRELPLLTVAAAVPSCAICLLLVLRRTSPDEEALTLLAVISLALLSQVYPDEGLWRRVLALSLGFGWPVYLLNHLFTSEQFGWLSRYPSSSLKKSLAPVFVVAALLPILLPKLTSVSDEVRMAFNFERHKEFYFQYMNKPEVLKGMWLPKEQASFYLTIYEDIERFRRRHPGAPVITTNGDVLPLTFVRSNEGFSPMFTVFPSIAWGNITRNPASHLNADQIQSALARGRRNLKFESDTTNVLAYADYWTQYAEFVRAKRPLVINSGRPVPHYVQVRTVVFHGSPGVVDSQYYFWWSQLSDKPQSVIWEPES
jgi:hypothetical protein